MCRAVCGSRLPEKFPSLTSRYLGLMDSSVTCHRPGISSSAGLRLVDCSETGHDGSGFKPQCRAGEYGRWMGQLPRSPGTPQLRVPRYAFHVWRSRPNPKSSLVAGWRRSQVPARRAGRTAADLQASVNELLRGACSASHERRISQFGLALGVKPEG